MVLGPSESEYSLVDSLAAFLHDLGYLGGTHEGNRLDLRVVAHGVNDLYCSVNYLEDSWGHACFDEELTHALQTDV